MSHERRTDDDLSHAPRNPSPSAPGKSTQTSRLSARPIVFRVASVEAARELGSSFGHRDDNGVAAGAETAVQRATESSGSALPDAVRGRFESSLGADLSAVRVHTGAASAEAASAVGARAYATGNDIHFGAGQYAPADPFGVHLLAHEVAHTVQQSGAAPTTQYKLEVSTPGDAAEVEADRAADAMVSGASARVSGGATGGAARHAIARAADESAQDADDNGEVFELRDPLIKGSLKDAGEWKDGKFVNATLQAALAFYGSRWGVGIAAAPAAAPDAKTDATPDATKTATPAATPDATKTATPAATPDATKTATPAAAKKPTLADFPPWFAAFQNKLVARKQWKKDEQAVSAILEAFARKQFPGAAAVAMSFFHHLGESVGNTGVDNLKIGARNSDGKLAYNYCAAASSKMLEEGLAAHGLAFKAGGYGAYYAAHSHGKSSILIGGAAALTAPLDPGDRVTIVSSDSALSGHVITIVQFQDPVITFVSGNTMGSSVKLEEARRGQPADAKYNFSDHAAAANVEDLQGQLASLQKKKDAGQDVDDATIKALETEIKHGQDQRAKGLPKNNQSASFVPGRDAPAQKGELWTTVIEKVSPLDPANLAGKSDAELDLLGLKRIK